MDANRKGRKIKLRYKIIPGVIIVIAALFSWLIISRNSELEKKYDEIRAAGYPVTLKELDDWYSIPEGEENAADVYVSAFKNYCDPVNKDPLPVIGTKDVPEPNEKLDAKTVKLLQDYISNNEYTLELLTEAAKIEHCRYPVDFTKGVAALMPHLKGNKNSSQLMFCKTILNIENGDKDSALENIKTSVQVADSRKNEPTFISHLVRIACMGLNIEMAEYVLSRTELSDNELRDLAKLFAKAKDHDAMVRALAGERCQIIDYLYHAHEYNSASGLGLPLKARLLSMSGFNKTNILEYIDISEDLLDAYKAPENKRIAKVEETEKRFYELSWIYTPLKVIVPAITKLTELDLRRRAHLRALLTGLAVERYRLAKGKLPDSLNELVGDYMDSVPLDPFDGKPLRYKKLDKGYVVYSIDEDGVDNGGKEKDSSKTKEWDITFKVER